MFGRLVVYYLYYVAIMTLCQHDLGVVDIARNFIAYRSLNLPSFRIAAGLVLVSMLKAGPAPNNMQQAPEFNKMAATGRQRSPNRASRGVIEVYPDERAAEYWAKCKCGSIVKVPHGGAVDCPCGRLLKWKTSPAPARERTIPEQPVR